eukprot:gnl/MRDRNA2_/MRDRNA2_56035_c0_seq1.p1 gnl/MRDRNA2_/MRDRNA2_56035_c0~~gnl/MRDRNA2_/MRDRNA2_56035_c0_seq1.p1  ORF type:complete len:706 (-),score=146.70 gnl/MRDRNA2_/MRDRNA2_56035_c0_seq1:231-2348(-)
MDLASTQTVPVPLSEYNQLFEKAYLNEKRLELDTERQKIEEARVQQEKQLRLEAERLKMSKKQSEREKRGAVSSRNWLLLRHSAQGSYQPGDIGKDGSMAVFDFTLEFRVFEDEWTVVPIVDAQVITDQWNVSHIDMKQLGTNLEDVEWNSVSSASDTIILIQEVDDGPARQTLATNRAGLYRVTFSAYVFVHSNRNLNSFSMNLLYPITSLQLRLKQESASRMAVRELNIVPAAQYATEEADGCVNISMRLPATKTVEVKWRSIDVLEDDFTKVESEKAPQEEMVQVIAHHDALHSITDGILQSSHTIKYTLDSEQTTLKTVRILIHGSVRVTSLTGYGVLTWKASSATVEDSSIAATAIEVFFKSSLIADNVMLLISTEMPLEEADVLIPTLVCDGVVRQTGSFGVVKVANVEVHEREAKGVTCVGVDELAVELKAQTNRPIMFAYKYQSPQFHVALSVVKHDQVGVLEAIVENALYQVLVVDTQSMHHLLLVLQNSRRQYLELRGVPTDAQIWSLMVNSVPAKPVRGKDGALLIPLLVNTDSNSNEGAQRTSVEVAFMSQHSTLGPNGIKDLAPLKLDIPISKFLMEVQMPKEYEVEFNGTLQKVSSFSSPVPQPVNYDKGTDIVPYQNFNFSSMPHEIPKKGVSVQIPRSGQCYRFEKLLVTGDCATLTAVYKTPPTKAPAAKFSWLEHLRGLSLCHRRRR